MIIETTNLIKYYKKTPALLDLNLHIEEGDIYGFIGPNGAGKTTTLRILATLLRPTRGDAKVCGFSVNGRSDEVRRRIGFMPDTFGVYEDMTVTEYLEFFAAAYRIPRTRRRQVVPEVLQLTDLDYKKDVPVTALSRGMQQRLSLARAIIHDPQVLLLDEPASGLDPRARIEIRALLKELSRMGKTILISSHILSELEQICNRIGIIEQGRLLLSESMAEVMRKVRGRPRVIVSVVDGHDKACSLLQSHPQIAGVETRDNCLVVSVANDEAGPGLVSQLLVDAGFALLSLREEELRLEDAFMRLTKGLVS